MSREVWNVFNLVFSVLGNTRRTAEPRIQLGFLAQAAYPDLSASHMGKTIRRSLPPRASVDRKHNPSQGRDLAAKPSEYGLKGQ